MTNHTNLITDCDFCTDPDCRSITSGGWLTCSALTINLDLRILEAAWDAWMDLLNWNTMPAAEVFNDPTDIAFAAYRRTSLCDLLD